MIGDCELAANDVCVAAVFTLPEFVTQDDSGRGTARCVIRVCEHATARGIYAERTIKVAADIKHPRRTHFTAGREVPAVCAPGEDSVECLLPVADLFPNRKSN